jgi:hypothetical protein
MRGISWLPVEQSAHQFGFCSMLVSLVSLIGSDLNKTVPASVRPHLSHVSVSLHVYWVSLHVAAVNSITRFRTHTFETLIDTADLCRLSSWPTSKSCQCKIMHSKTNIIKGSHEMNQFNGNSVSSATLIPVRLHFYVPPPPSVKFKPTRTDKAHFCTGESTHVVPCRAEFRHC